MPPLRTHCKFERRATVDKSLAEALGITVEEPAKDGGAARETSLKSLSTPPRAHPPKAADRAYQNRYKAGTYKECILVRLETDGGVVAGRDAGGLDQQSFEGTPEEPLRKQAVGRDPFDIEAWYAENTLAAIC